VEGISPLAVGIWVRSGWERQLFLLDCAGAGQKSTSCSTNNAKLECWLFVFPDRSWLGPLLALGYSRPLQEDDLGELAFMDRAGQAGAKLSKTINDELGLDKPSLFRAYRRAIGGVMVYPALCKLVGDVLGFVQVSVLKPLTRSSRRPS
jgi:hypothetical protein